MYISKSKVLLIAIFPALLLAIYIISSINKEHCYYLNKDSCGKILEYNSFNNKKTSLFELYENELGERKKVDSKIYTNIERGRQELYKIKNSDLLTTGDVVFDALLLESKNYFRKKNQSEQTVLVIPANESSSRVAKYYQPINYILNEMFGKKLKTPTKFFVTDSKDTDSSSLRKIASSNNCVIPDFGYIREKGKFYGAHVFSNTCGEQPSIVLDLWQYKYSIPEDPQMIMQTVSDELMTVWQQLNKIDYEKNSREFAWFYQGSQQLPFLLFMINEEGLFLDFNEKCGEMSLNDLFKNKYIGGRIISCDHTLGLLATKLIVANKGIDKLLGFFEDESSSSFEEKFKNNFGITLDQLSVKLDLYLVQVKDKKKIESVEMYNKLVNDLKF